MTTFIYPTEYATLLTPIWSALVNPLFKLDDRLGWWAYRRLIRSIKKKE